MTIMYIIQYYVCGVVISMIKVSFCSVDLILSEQCSEEFPKNDEFVDNTDSKVYIASTPFCHLGKMWFVACS